MKLLKVDTLEAALDKLEAAMRSGEAGDIYGTGTPKTEMVPVLQALDRIAADPIFGLTRAEIDKIISESRLTGIAKEQTEAYVKEVRKVLSENSESLKNKVNTQINV